MCHKRCMSHVRRCALLLVKFLWRILLGGKQCELRKRLKRTCDRLVRVNLAADTLVATLVGGPTGTTRQTFVLIGPHE